MKKAMILAMLTALLLAGCTAPATPTPSLTPDPDGQATEGSTVTSTIDVDVTQLFSHRDFATDYEKAATVTLRENGASCDSDAVRIDGSTVTVTDEGTYVFTGTLSGTVAVDADKQDKVQLVLDGVQITTENAAAIEIRQADKVFVTLAAGSENSLTSNSFPAGEDSNIDGVLFSKADLTLNGSGSLSVSSPAGHGIVSKDDLTVTGGMYSLTTAGHGMEGKDRVAIAGGSFTLACGKDGIHAENNDDAALGYVYLKDGSFSLSAEGDGISAGAWMQIDGGSYTVVTGGGSENAQKQQSDNWGNMGGGMGRPGGMGGMQRPGSRTADGMSFVTTDTTDSTSIKGMKAGGELKITGGTFQLDCADDAVHSNGDLTLTGGAFQIATGDDGFHADGTLTVSGGEVKITESYEGLEGLHVRVQEASVTLTASHDGINAAGGTDQSGFGGNRGDMFGGMGRPGGIGRPGGMGGGMSSGNGSIVISGGSVSITASGDGIDANGSLEITGGQTIVCGPTRGDTATLDYDTTATITGGSFIGTGASGMAQTFSNAEQGLISLSVGSQSAGTQIRITDESGTEVLSHTPALDYAW